MLTPEEEALYDQLDEDLTAGNVQLGTPVRLSGKEMTPSELSAVLRGRPTLGQTHASGEGRSPRRQVCLGSELDKEFEAYLKRNHLTASAALRHAVEQMVHA